MARSGKPKVKRSAKQGKTDAKNATFRKPRNLIEPPKPVENLQAKAMAQIDRLVELCENTAKNYKPNAYLKPSRRKK